MHLCCTSPQLTSRCHQLLVKNTRFANHPPALAMRSPTVLFIPASIRSHVLPALYLADLLAEDYDVHFAVTNDVLAELVRENGFSVVRNSGYRALVGMESEFVQREKKQKPGYLNVARAYWNREVGKYRQRELDDLIRQTKPAAIFLDIFSSTDYLFLAGRYPDIPLLFINTMLSTYRVNGYPVVSEGTWMREPAQPTHKPQSGFNWRRVWKQPVSVLMQAIVDRGRKKLLAASGIRLEDMDGDNPFTPMFRRVPELVLAPLEFEFSPQVRQEWQHYLGLCTRSQRRDTELDPLFEGRWQGILERRGDGGKLVYCSFGTFYEGPDKTLLTFVENLLEVLNGFPNVQLVCSVNRLVIETVQARHTNLSNVHFFSRVPQLRVLEETDLFITHGGLGSVKEAIEYGVPVLAYPLDLKYDQNGNAFKIEHHGLGLRGNFQFERVSDLRAKLTRLLTDDAFRRNLKAFQADVANRYSFERNQALLRQLLGQPKEKYQFANALSA